MSTVRELRLMRVVLLAVVLGHYFQKFFVRLPHGRAIAVNKADRPICSNVDQENDSLRRHHGRLSKIFERVPEGTDPIVKGPETVVFNKEGTAFVMTEDAKLVKLYNFQPTAYGYDMDLTASATTVLDLGVGRPLGGAFDTRRNVLYIADAHLGLIRVKDPEQQQQRQHPHHHAKVELVASRVKDNVTGEWTQILFADDVAIGPKSGMVYFTDATDIAPERIGTYSWDVMFASKLDSLRGKAEGRLLQYDPKTDITSILATGIHFANGIAVDSSETFIMISESAAYRVLKYHLKGDKKGTTEVMADKFPGYPDGADCNPDTGLCYAPLVSSVLTLVKVVDSMLPNILHMAVRNLFMSIPRSMVPNLVPYCAIVEIFPGNTTHAPHVTRILQDPKGQDIGRITGTTIHKGKLYLGSLHNSYIGVYDLTADTTCGEDDGIGGTCTPR